MKTYLILISGKVQGVGFRHTTWILANKLKITGTVENLSNGEVKIIVQGQTSDLKCFINCLHHLPNSAATIKHIYVRRANIKKNYTAFKVKF